MSKRNTDEEISSRLSGTGFFTDGTIFKRNLEKSTVKETYIDVLCPVCESDPAGKVKSTFTALYGNLLRGQVPCRCSKKRLWLKEELFCILAKELGDRDLLVTGLAGPKMTDIVSCSCEKHGPLEKTVRDALHGKTGCPRCAGLDHNLFYIHGVYDRDTLVALKYGISKKSNHEARLYRQNKESLYRVEIIYSVMKNNPRLLESKLKSELPAILSKREMPDGYTETCGSQHLDYILSLCGEDCRFRR